MKIFVIVLTAKTVISLVKVDITIKLVVSSAQIIFMDAYNVQTQISVHSASQASCFQMAYAISNATKCLIAKMSLKEKIYAINNRVYA
jgi:hypothetical protein